MSANVLSLFIVNGVTGLMLGLSCLLAIDVWPWLKRHNHWWVLVVIVLLWGGGIVLASSLDTYDLIARRLINAVAVLYVAALLLAYIRKEPSS
jgi:cytochrome b subunit of formate dehydrogenase